MSDTERDGDTRSLLVGLIMATESMEQLLNAELREAFDEFDKVNTGFSIEMRSKIFQS